MLRRQRTMIRPPPVGRIPGSLSLTSRRRPPARSRNEKRAHDRSQTEPRSGTPQHTKPPPGRAGIVAANHSNRSTDRLA